MTVLDLTGVACPMNWVKARLALEQLDPGERLELLLDEGEPLLSVPASARDDGHSVSIDGQTVTIVKGSV